MQRMIHGNGFPSLRMLLSLLGMLGIAACSSGGGGGGGASSPAPRPDESAAGIWAGTITSDSAAGPLQLSGVVTETGELQFTSPDGGIVYTGSIEVDGDEITGTLEGVNFAGFLPGALPAGSIDIDGTVSSQGTISGTFSGADTGSFSLAYSDSYERSAELGKLASDWVSIGNLFFKAGIGGENDVLAVMVDDMGSLTGGDTGGCSYQASFTVGDPQFNAYAVQLNLADCGGLSGAYAGLAYLADDAGPSDTLAVSASNMAVAIAFSADRVSSRSAAGIWTGTITSDLDMLAVPISAIVAETGESVFFVDDQADQLAGPIQVSGNFLDSTVNAYAAEGEIFPNGTSFGSVLLRGLVETAVSIDLSYDGVGDTGQIILAYDSSYEDGSALTTVEADWRFDDGAGDTLDISIDAAGNITGSDSDGCTYTGTIALIDPAGNAYDVDVTLSGCAAAGDYSGLASVLDDAAPADTLVVGVSSITLQAALSVSLTRSSGP